MMKNRLISLILLFTLVLLVGCTDKPAGTQTAPVGSSATLPETVKSPAVAPQSGSAHTITSENGRYEGDVLDGQRYGQGTFTWDNGDVYSGDWYAGQMHGLGLLVFQGTGQYKGSFVDGKRVGQGTFVWVDGHRYEGTWKDDLMDGFGRYTFPSGEAYSGEWAKGQMHGQGEYTLADGSTLSGRWESNEFIEAKKAE
jgi:hypothetical protein